MHTQRFLLLLAGGAGVVAIGAGLLGFDRIAGASAAVLLVLFLVLPWMRQEHRTDLHRPPALTRALHSDEGPSILRSRAWPSAPELGGGRQPPKDPQESP